MPGAIHVLLAGGELELRRSLARVLESRGLRVAVVEDGAQALAHIQADGAPCEAILVTAPGDVESAVDAVEEGLLSAPGQDPTRGMLADLARLPYTEAKRRLLSLFDETYTGEVLRSARGNLSEAARRAGLDRSNFRRLLKRQASPARDE